MAGKAGGGRALRPGRPCRHRVETPLLIPFAVIILPLLVQRYARFTQDGLPPGY
jgi:hypothetical protein